MCLAEPLDQGLGCDFYDKNLMTLHERLELANQLYREYHTRCFWHCPRDLEITEELIPFVAKGLRTNGGRSGFVLASKLLPAPAHGQPGLLS